MRYSKIEKTIVLSLLLSSSIYGTASAVPLVSDNTEGFITDGTSTDYDGNNQDINFNVYQDADSRMGFGIWAHGNNTTGDALANYDNINNLTINVHTYAYEYLDPANKFSQELAAGIIAGKTPYIGSELNQNDNKKATVEINVKNNVNLDIETRNEKSSYGIYSKKNGSVNITTNEGSININARKGLSTYKALPYHIENADYTANVYGIKAENTGEIILKAGDSININAFISDVNDLKDWDGFDENYEELKEGNIYAISNEKGDIDLQAINTIKLTAEANKGNAYGIYTDGVNDDKNNKLSANSNIITATSQTGEAYAIYANNSNVNLSANTVNYLESTGNGITAQNNSNISFTGNTIIQANKNGIEVNNSKTGFNGDLNIFSGQQGEDNNGNIFYDGIAINVTSSNEEKSEINALGANNTIGGTILASGVNTNVKVGNENYTSENNIYAKTHVVDEGENHIVSAVYAKDGAIISLNGINNIGTLANSGHNDDKERTIWAEQGTININGLTNIHASNGSIEQPNNVGIAIAAGGSDIKDNSDKAGVVNAVLNNGSYIFGDILAGKNGKVDLSINPIMLLNEDSVSKSGIIIQGNILAANGGVVNANLGANSVLTGRIDSYMDATDHPEHGSKFFAPEFSNEIETKGTVSLTLDENSRWNLTGQSWVDELNINGAGTIIDMVGSNTDKDKNGHALTIGNLNGDANFKMSLRGDEDHSDATDMIYIKNGNGNFNVIVDEAITESDITDAGDAGLRFATIGNKSNVKFKNVGTYNAGAFDVKYAVESSTYTSDDEENDKYNGEDFSEDKPGSENIDDFFKSEEESITTLSIETKESDESAIATNYNIVGIAGRELNNIGKTIINLSRANYANAIYMDNMNQRLGEARYLEGNEGFWVKLGHNSIGKDNAFDIDNNVYQLGYDKLHQEENGARRIGVVADYMTGDTSYDNISANGEVSRKGLWLYDTWTGNDGHYTDFVAKWGHLENNFDIYLPDQDVVNGEYNNDVFALSEEYGYKKSLGNNWYIEPQIQLQYAYITGADYMTSQDTNVRLDAINSLISRAGFRLGREFGKDNKTNLYLKGNIMHEFLGDQDIRTWDDTGVLDGTFDNDGTWYNIGIGVSTMLSDSSYAYVDYERSFGNDNDNTYQVNGGVRWAF